jgi:hypothetical protein
MKTKNSVQNVLELNVDFIGGEGTLTKEEEKQISEFIQSRKISKVKPQIRVTGMNKKRKSFA